MTWRATAAGAAALSHLIVSDALCLVCVAYVLNFPNFVVLFGLACYLSPARPSRVRFHVLHREEFTPPN
jgi:hypothetical protein